MKELKFIYQPKEEKPEYAKFACGIVHRAGEFMSDITLKSKGTNGDTIVDLKSILGVVSLHASLGKELTITIEGIDEDEAYMSLKAYVEKW
jgi:phosphotransferase system HPr (HPr) family protein